MYDEVCWFARREAGIPRGVLVTTVFKRLFESRITSEMNSAEKDKNLQAVTNILVVALPQITNNMAAESLVSSY
jgi:hypothetical protein